MEIKKLTGRNNIKISPKSVVPIFGALALSLLTGCSSVLVSQFQEPDLIPEGRSDAEGPHSYCNLNENGDLIVIVRNQTNNDVLIETITTVSFSTGEMVSQTTSPIPGGSFATKVFTLPDNCFSADCTFTIEVDSSDVLDESHGSQPDNHETNNKAKGICIG